MIVAKQKLNFFLLKNGDVATCECVYYSVLCDSQNFKMETQSHLDSLPLSARGANGNDGGVHLISPVCYQSVAH